MGLWMHQLLATPCVTLSLALVALGGSNLTGWFHLRTLNFGRPYNNCGTYFGYGGLLSGSSTHLPNTHRF
jgi:hypothetical protein